MPPISPDSSTAGMAGPELAGSPTLQTEPSRPTTESRFSNLRKKSDLAAAGGIAAAVSMAERELHSHAPVVVTCVLERRLACLWQVVVSPITVEPWCGPAVVRLRIVWG